ncbi:MFS transporter [Zongyangia hominis]|uniref:MFS transporter n=1 Tax=Zongyangia hominis TaxID=2763677 RepID=A0A926EB07_9FIRM|nr:MFS transporter [Zongyangia hominis]MBC8571220.1 MFS transporter [Zongyangia hominis]
MEKENKRQQRLLLAIVALFWFAQYIYVPFQTPYLGGIQVSAAMIGIIIGAYGVTQMTLRLPIGVLADYRGRHKGFILIGALMAGGASALRFLFPSGMGFLVANLLSGCASSMWISFMVLYTSFFEKEGQQSATSRIILFNNVGVLLGFLSGTLLYGRFGMPVLVVLSAAAGFAGAGLALLLKENGGNGTAAAPIMQERPRVGGLLRICANRRLILFALFALIQQGIQMATTMSFTTQVLKDLGASSSVIGFSSILYMLSSVFFAWLASTRVCERHGPKVWIPAVFAVVVAYCLLVGHVGSIPVIFLLQILPGLSTGVLLSYIISEAMLEVPPQQKSTAMGFFQAVYAIGMTAFPMLTGSLAEHLSVSSAYDALGVIALLGSIGAAAFYLRQKRRAVPDLQEERELVKSKTR